MTLDRNSRSMASEMQNEARELIYNAIDDQFNDFNIDFRLSHGKFLSVKSNEKLANENPREEN